MQRAGPGLPVGAQQARPGGVGGTVVPCPPGPGRPASVPRGADLVCPAPGMQRQPAVSRAAAVAPGLPATHVEHIPQAQLLVPLPQGQVHAHGEVAPPPEPDVAGCAAEVRAVVPLWHVVCALGACRVGAVARERAASGRMGLDAPPYYVLVPVADAHLWPCCDPRMPACTLLGVGPPMRPASGLCAEPAACSQAVRTRNEADSATRKMRNSTAAMLCHARDLGRSIRLPEASQPAAEPQGGKECQARTICKCSMRNCTVA